MPRAKKVARAVLVMLYPYGRLGTGAKAIAQDANLPLRTVQRSIARLLETGEVRKTGAGYASSAVFHDLTTDPTALLGFQNLKFVVEDWRMDPVPPCRMARVWSVKDGGSAGSIESVEMSWEGRRVRLTYYPSKGVLEGIIGAVVPIPNAKAGELTGWLTAMLGLGQGEKARLTFIEVNADHRHIRLEENYIELRDLPGVSHVIYQKTQALRHEIRLSDPRDQEGNVLPLQRALALLVEGSPEARMERLIRLELELASKQVELARAAPPETAQVRRDPGKVGPSEAIGEGFG